MTTKKCLFAALLFLCLTTIQAQEISFGLKGGVNLANVNATQAIDQLTPDFKDITTLTFGGVAELGINENFAIQSELLYTQKGFGIRQGVDVNLFNIPLPLGVTAETRFNYLEMPLLAKVKFGQREVKGFLMAGPTFGYATSGKLVTKANVLIDFTLTNTPINLDAINFERFELVVLSEVDLVMTPHLVNFLLKPGTITVFTQLYDIPLVDETLRNRNISIGAGVMIPINN